MTLLVEKSADIPMVRRKVKLLAQSIGCRPRLMAGLATAASEMGRLLLNACQGGKVEVAFLSGGGDRHETFLEIVFHSKEGCRVEALQGGTKGITGKEISGVAPFLSLRKVFEEVEIEGGAGIQPLVVRCYSDLSELPETEKLFQRITSIRKELFVDTEESYMENLRAKHDEVLRLLQEKTEQNRMLDQSNNELLQLSNDLEVLAQERTIIEMSLKIADQVRNPATVIGGLSRQLLRKGELEKKAALKIQQIAVQAEHIDQVVHRFHTMADERRDLFVQEDLIQLVKDALLSCPTMVRRRITPLFEAGERAIFIHANRRILKVALVHVLRYAATLTLTGGQLAVEVDSSQESATVTVIDQGVGFAASALDELSQPIENKPLVGQPGLSLVQHILAEHQGEILAESSTENGEEGRIILRFPLTWHEHGATYTDLSTLGIHNKNGTP